MAKRLSRSGRKRMTDEGLDDVLTTFDAGGEPASGEIDLIAAEVDELIGRDTETLEEDRKSSQ